MSEFEETVCAFVEAAGTQIEYLTRKLEAQDRTIDALWAHLDAVSKLGPENSGALQRVQAALALIQPAPAPAEAPTPVADRFTVGSDVLGPLGHSPARSGDQAR